MALQLTSLATIKSLIIISLLGACVVGCGGGAVTSSGTLSLVAPSQREDGTALSMSEIQAYRIYYGSISRDYHGAVDIEDGGATSVNVTDLGIPSGTYYIAITVIDTDGRESRYSTEVSASL